MPRPRYPSDHRREKSRPIPWRLALRVWDECVGRCHYCDSPLEPEITEIDHVIPLAKGGRTEFSNLVLACRPCNRWKGAQDYLSVITEMRCTPPVWTDQWPDRWDWEAGRCLG